jgi:peptidoglycan hydrolase-like protein with peptidoglycan-binding domain
VRSRLPDSLPGRRTLAIGAIAALAAGTAFAVLSGGGEGERADAQDPGVPTVELERRDLVARESVDGTLGYAGEAAVINRLAGTITWLPAEGDVIGRGGRLFEVDGEPVALMYGDVPAYRELASGVSDGPDVKQLEANLTALGFDAGGSLTVDAEFTSATTEAVAEWQESLDLDETGTVELGRVAFLAGARRVVSLSVALGADASSSGAGVGTDVSGAAGAPQTTFASYVAAEAPAEPDEDGGKREPQQGGKKKKPAGKPEVKGGGKDTAQQAEEAPAAQAPSSAEDADPAAEASAAAGSASTEVMTTSSERRAVTVELDPADSDLAERGSRAIVALPDGKEVKGTVSSVGTVAESAESATGEETEPTIEVTIALPDGKRVSGLDQAPVSVELTDEVRRDVFAVPVESLLGTAGDGYAIVISEAGERRQVPVEPGLFADGYVEVEGEDLREGSLVEVPGE